MSITEKVALVNSVRSAYGLKPALAAVELAKSTWYYQQDQKIDYEQKYAQLRPVLEEIAREHPGYGYRRTTAELRERLKQPISRKVVQRLNQLWDLKLIRTTRPPKPSRVRQVITKAGHRANLVAHLAQIGLFEVVYTDFTELLYREGQRKAYLMPIIGHTSKLVCGWALGHRTNTELALQAWSRTKETFQRLGRDFTGLIVHHDQDAVYTSYAWTGQLLLNDQVRLSYALGGAPDNPEMESFNSRFKTENESLFLQAQSFDQLQRVVAEQITYYNQQRRHSSLGYVSPMTFIRQANC